MSSRTIATWSIYLVIFLIFGLVPQIGFISVGTFAITTMAIPMTLVVLHKRFMGLIFGIIMYIVIILINMFIIPPATIGIIGWGKSFVVFGLSKILLAIPLSIYLFITSKVKKINILIDATFIALLITIFNTLFVFTLLILMSSTFIFSALFITSSVNIIVEWTAIVFLAITISVPVVRYLRIKDKQFESYRLK